MEVRDGKNKTSVSKKKRRDGERAVSVREEEEVDGGY